MPVTKEFTVLMEDQPGTLGKVCRALSDRGVNILALQSFPIGGKSVVRIIADNHASAKPRSTSITHTAVWNPRPMRHSCSSASPKSAKRRQSLNRLQPPQQNRRPPETSDVLQNILKGAGHAAPVFIRSTAPAAPTAVRRLHP